MIEQNLIERVVHVPGDSFVDTKISTCIIVFRKDKSTTDIVFEDMETGKERTVSVEEVKENGYTLSVSSYIYEEPQRETIDPGKIQRDAQMAFLQSLRAQLDFEKTIAEMDGRSIQPLIAEIEAIISEYKAAG